MKEAGTKRVHTVSLHLYNILENANQSMVTESKLVF